MLVALLVAGREAVSIDREFDRRGIPRQVRAREAFEVALDSDQAPEVANGKLHRRPFGVQRPEASRLIRAVVGGFKVAAHRDVRLVVLGWTADRDGHLVGAGDGVAGSSRRQDVAPMSTVSLFISP